MRPGLVAVIEELGQHPVPVSPAEDRSPQTNVDCVAVDLYVGTGPAAGSDRARPRGGSTQPRHQRADGGGQGSRAAQSPSALEQVATSRSAISRRFVEGSERRLGELFGRDLSRLKILVAFIDGIVIGDHSHPRTRRVARARPDRRFRQRRLSPQPRQMTDRRNPGHARTSDSRRTGSWLARCEHERRGRSLNPRFTVNTPAFVLQIRC